jgi:hypothetical protein
MLGPVIIIGLGFAILLMTLEFPEANLYPIAWPAALAIGGFIIILMGVDWSDKRLPYQNRVRQFAWLGAKELTSRAPAFQLADITALIGYFKLDLTQARLSRSTHVNVTAIFGSVDIIVPEGVRIYKRQPFLLDRFGLHMEEPPPTKPEEGIIISVLGIFAKVVTSELAPKSVAIVDRKEGARMAHEPYYVEYSPEYGDDTEDTTAVPIDSTADTQVVRLSVNLLGAELKSLQAIAERHGTTLTEAVRRCIATQDWVEQLEEGTRVILEGPGKRHRRVVFR